MKKTFLLLVFILVLAPIMPSTVCAEDTTEDVVEISTEEAGVTAEAAASATVEATTIVNEAGMLIEIGNTTAEETTIIIRVTRDGEQIDQTVQITSDTTILTNSNRSADLSDWIAGDHISYTAKEGDNSGELVAIRLKNHSFKYWHIGRNGWVKEIRSDENEMDVEWAGKIYTLNTENAKMVAGLKNPASLEDFQIGDRVRGRVSEDGDGNPLTQNAEIIVVLRRGEDLFMRVTRWVVPAEITSIPEDTSELPYTITAKVLESKFYEKGDVNNLIGEPGTEITIKIDENTRLVRRYLGRANIGEFMEGDKIRVIGRLNEDTGYIDANLVKNNSIQRLGVSNRIGEVLSVDTSANTISATPIGIKNPITGKRRKISNALTWTVQLNENTEIKEMGEDISLNDIEVGDIIRVRGTANRRTTSVDANAVAVVTDRYKLFLEN